MIIKSVAGGMLIESSGTALSVILFFMLPALLHWLSKRRFLRSSLDPRADILLPNWERGQPAAMDVTVISSLQPLTLQRAASSAGHALSVGEQRKMSAHAPACRAVGVSFIPLAFEALAGMSDNHLVVQNWSLLGQRLGVSPTD